MSGKKEKKVCFVIGPIGAADSNTRVNADFLLDGIIKEVLEKQPFNYIVKRADKDVSPGSINTSVINDIIHADLAIADLSERNPNAFYELGIRHAFHKPVIHMVREGEVLPFDNLDQRCIYFSTESWAGILRARENLFQVVQHVISDSYIISSPVTIANAVQAMSEQGDSTGVLISSLSERLQNIEKKINKSENISAHNMYIDKNIKLNNLRDNNTVVMDEIMKHWAVKN